MLPTRRGRPEADPPPRPVLAASPPAVSTIWVGRLERAAETIDRGGREQITCFLTMMALLADTRACWSLLRRIAEHARDEARAGEGHYRAAAMLEEVLPLIPRRPRPGWKRCRRKARALHRRIVALQPGHRRIGIRATRRAGRDRLLLIGEACLQAAYGGWTMADDGPDAAHRHPAAEPAAIERLSFYETLAYFVCEWDDGRFRMTAASARRLRLILAWWKEHAGAAAITPPPRNGERS